MTQNSSSYSLFRHTLRRLLRERGFSATVLLTLALCIGANVAMYAVIDAILLRAMPFPEADRLIITINSYPGAGAERVGASHTNYYQRREKIDSFESTSMFQPGSAIIGEAGSPQRVERGRVSPEFFDTLKVPLAMGRAFTDDDMVYANAQILIITHEFWQTQFNGDPNVLGREIVVDSIPNTVVGVLAPGFRFLDIKAKFFIPLASNLEERAMDRRHSNNVGMIARLKDGVTLAEAQLEMDAFNEAQYETDPYAQMVKDAGFRTHVFNLHDDTVREAKPILLILQAGALSLLILGLVNLTNLLLIRAKGREKETAVRQSLGAGRFQVAKETLAETLCLSAGGGLLGIGFGTLGIRLLATLGTDKLPFGTSIAIDGRVLAISLFGSILVGIILAVPIVAINTRRNLSPALSAESRGGTVSRSAQLVRFGFIVVQIALAFALLSGAGLLGLSLKKALDSSPGFQTEQILTARISLPWKNYPESEQRLAFMKRLTGELRTLPGVTYAGISDMLPFTGNASNNATVVEGAVPAPGESIRTHYTGFAYGEYWQSLGIPLVEGRFLEDRDIESDQRVCVIDQTFKNRYWPDQSALGRRIATDVEINDENALTIVGVVGTVKQNDLTDTAPLGTIYLPYNLRTMQGFSLAIRTPMNPESLSNALRSAVLQIDPELPVDDTQVMQSRVDDSLIARRSPAILASIFAGVALLLAAIGTYGVLAYAVTQRRREIGVRIALGALPSVVLKQFFVLGMKLLAIGVILGSIVTWVVGIAMQNVLFDVDSLHWGIIAIAAALMWLVVSFATFIPSRRAASVSPLEAIRDD